MSLLTKLRLALSRPSPPERRVSFDDAGFVVQVGGSLHAEVLWSQVEEISAFKQDIFSCDRICFGFRLAGSEEFVWVSEEDLPFAGFAETVASRFPDLRTDWYEAVA